MKGLGRKRDNGRQGLKKINFISTESFKRIHPLRAEYFLKEILREQGRALRNEILYGKHIFRFIKKVKM